MLQTRPSTGPHTPSQRRRGLLRAATTALTALAVAGATLLAPTGAQAALRTHGLPHPQTGFPSFYTEQSGGLTTQLCIDGTAACGGATAGTLNAADGSGEAFYWTAQADVTTTGGVRVLVDLALEAAQAAAGPGQQIVFDRLRVRVDNVPAGNYRLDHPYGSTPLVSTGSGVRAINLTDDIGCAAAPCNFDLALNGRITNFLRSTSAPAGYLGDGATPTTVTGSSLRNDLSLVNLATNQVVASTDLFAVTGKQLAGPQAFLSNPTVEFGNVATASQAVTVTNTGNQPLVFSGAPATSGNGFGVAATTCAGSIAPGLPCTVTVTYTALGPTASATATLSLPTNTAGGPVVVPLHATTLAAATVTGGPVAFPAQKVRTTSAPRAVTVVNTGVAPLAPPTAAVTGPFTVPTIGCKAALAPGAACTIATSYRPTAFGAQTGTLTISHPGAANAPASAVALSGRGSAPVAGVNRTSIGFGRGRLGRNSPARVLRLSNRGDVVMAVGPPTMAGPFRVVSSNCRTRLAPGASCNLAVAFHPTRLGRVRGSLRLRHDAASGPRTIVLTGRGSRTAAPSAPRAVGARPGGPGGRVTATVSWSVPRDNGGSSIRGYRVTVRRVGFVHGVTRNAGAGDRSLTVTGLVRGASYRFAVRAVNGAGTSLSSRFTAAVRAR